MVTVSAACLRRMLSEISRVCRLFARGTREIWRFARLILLLCARCERITQRKTVHCERGGVHAADDVASERVATDICAADDSD